MIRKAIASAAAAAVIGLAAVTGAQAASHAACAAPNGPDDITFAEANAVYECLSAKMYEGYQKGDKRWIPINFVVDYKNWKPASTAPAAPGQHSNRFLYTRVNEIGYDAYTAFAEDQTMPTGTVISKESFTIGSDGKAKPGPLFIMEKVAPGASSSTNDWYYMMVSAKGAPIAVDVWKNCHECHSGFDFQDSLGYPVEEVRIGD